jgi:hypothetical protein
MQNRNSEPSTMTEEWQLKLLELLGQFERRIKYLETLSRLLVICVGIFIGYIIATNRW